MVLDESKKYDMLLELDISTVASLTAPVTCPEIGSRAKSLDVFGNNLLDSSIFYGQRLGIK